MLLLYLLGAARSWHPSSHLAGVATKPAAGGSSIIRDIVDIALAALRW